MNFTEQGVFTMKADDSDFCQCVLEVILAFDKYAPIIDIGYRAAQERIAAWQAARAAGGPGAAGGAAVGAAVGAATGRQPGPAEE